MIKTLSIKELLETVEGELLQTGENMAVEHIITDSRKIISPATSLFIPLKGLQYDGHLFVASAYDSGVRHFIVNKTHLPDPALPGATIFAVQDTLEALQK